MSEEKVMTIDDAVRMVKQARHARDRRVDVENILNEMAGGKRPMPTAQDLKDLANRLGSPEIFRDAELDRFKLAPVEPTQDQIDAGNEALGMPLGDAVAKVYKAMLGTAP